MSLVALLGASVEPWVHVYSAREAHNIESKVHQDAKGLDHTNIAPDMHIGEELTDRDSA